MDETSNTSNEPLQDPPDDPKVMLIAVDASPEAALVVATAVRVSRSMPKATIHVVHVFRTSLLDRPIAGTSTTNADALEEAKERLAYHVRSIRRQTRAQVVGHLGMGDAADEILRLTAELDSDLLVVGTHNHAGFERLILGSITETLMRKAGCPVLVVRPKAHT